MKEQFAINDYRRAYGTNIPFVQSRYDSEPYALEQEVVAWELPELSGHFAYAKWKWG